MLYSVIIKIEKVDIDIIERIHMKVEIIVDKNFNEPEVKIYTSSLTQEIVELQNVIK